jgi:hypothetical protein
MFLPFKQTLNNNSNVHKKYNKEENYIHKTNFAIVGTLHKQLKTLKLKHNCNFYMIYKPKLGCYYGQQ